MTEQEEFEFRYRLENERDTQRATQPKRESSTAQNIAGGILKGASEIGATLMTPIDAAARAMGVQNSFIGRDDRRQAVDQFMQQQRVNTDSFGYGAGKIGTEIAGTAGVGGALAKGASMVPGVASKAPALIEALRTGGMSGGINAMRGLPIGELVKQLAIQTGAGATVGAASAGLINPQQAEHGATWGAALPVAGGIIGKTGQIIYDKKAAKIAKALRDSTANTALRDAIQEGYVVPPNMVNPSMKNALVESFSGKQATEQIASTKNQDVTERLVRQSLGLTDDIPLNKQVLNNIRKSEGKAYADIASMPIKAPQRAEPLMNLPAIEGFNPAKAVNELKQARNDAQSWFNAYNRSASPSDLTKAKAFQTIADSLETQIDDYAKSLGNSDALKALRESRKQIAKTYTVERALNDASGEVNAKIIAKLYEKGSPLSDGLETIGKFASAYPKVNQSAQQIGSPGAHNLRAMGSLLLGSGGAAIAGAPGIAAAVIPYAAGAASRGLMFRKGAQNALTNQAAPISQEMDIVLNWLRDPALQFISKSSPVLAANSGNLAEWLIQTSPSTAVNSR